MKNIFFLFIVLVSITSCEKKGLLVSAPYQSENITTIITINYSEYVVNYLEDIEALQFQIDKASLQDTNVVLEDMGNNSAIVCTPESFHNLKKLNYLKRSLRSLITNLPDKSSVYNDGLKSASKEVQFLLNARRSQYEALSILQNQYQEEDNMPYITF